jgi:hypothetical protein
VSLPLGANVLRVLDADRVARRDLTARAGISKEAVAMAVGYLQRTGLAEAAPGGAIRLTRAGVDARADYGRRAPRTMPELQDALESVLAQRDALAAGLVPPENGWRAQRPYLNQTQRVLADPTAALPWQPMVLHRGGWPDGS